MNIESSVVTQEMAPAKPKNFWEKIGFQKPKPVERVEPSAESVKKAEAMPSRVEQTELSREINRRVGVDNQNAEAVRTKREQVEAGRKAIESGRQVNQEWATYDKAVDKAADRIVKGKDYSVPEEPTSPKVELATMVRSQAENQRELVKRNESLKLQRGALVELPISSDKAILDRAAESEKRSDALCLDAAEKMKPMEGMDGTVSVDNLAALQKMSQEARNAAVGAGREVRMQMQALDEVVDRTYDRYGDTKTVAAQEDQIDDYNESRRTAMSLEVAEVKVEVDAAALQAEYTAKLGEMGVTDEAVMKDTLAELGFEYDEEKREWSLSPDSPIVVQREASARYAAVLEASKTALSEAEGNPDRAIAAYAGMERAIVDGSQALGADSIIRQTLVRAQENQEAELLAQAEAAEARKRELAAIQKKATTPTGAEKVMGWFKRQAEKVVSKADEMIEAEAKKRKALATGREEWQIGAEETRLAELQAQMDALRAKMAKKTS